mmetsp:Transcript_26505/g.39730  ORF Transcript_26505/g.39730 Transcript_26505/m.39730 type:complete len:107 (+) Transcript_26505:2116-2436(+)
MLVMILHSTSYNIYSSDSTTFSLVPVIADAVDVDADVDADARKERPHEKMPMSMSMSMTILLELVLQVAVAASAAAMVLLNVSKEVRMASNLIHNEWRESTSTSMK